MGAIDANPSMSKRRIRRTPGERRMTAFHEAGHAVAHLVSGRPFRYVTIRADRRAGSAGHVAQQWRHMFPPSRQEIDGVGVIILLAGPIAVHIQDILDRKPVVLGALNGAGNDLTEACRILGDGPAGIPIFEQWASSTMALVEAYWPAVKAIASALLGSRKRLTWKKARPIFEAALSPDGLKLVGDLRKALRARRPETALLRVRESIEKVVGPTANAGVGE